MGVIQNSVNSALSGTAFLLKQSGLFDEHQENMRLNREGEKKLKELDSRKEAMNKAYFEEREGQKFLLNSAKETVEKMKEMGIPSSEFSEAEDIVKHTEAGLRAMNDKFDEKHRELREEGREIRLGTPKYRQKELELKNYKEFSDEFSKAFLTEKMTDHLKEAVDAKENGELIKDRLAEIYGWEDA